MSAVRIGRAFSPDNHLGNLTQGVALGWYGTGPLALGSLHFAPTAQPHTSLGHRPDPYTQISRSPWLSSPDQFSRSNKPESLDIQADIQAAQSGRSSKVAAISSNPAHSP